MCLLESHAQAIQSAGALVTAAAAMAAVFFVPWQIAPNERSSREQAARENYREILSISIQRPELTSGNVCTLADPVQRTAHEGYVEYLPYTAEQVFLKFWEALTGAVTSMDTPMLARGALPDIQRHVRTIAGAPPVPTKGRLQEGARGPRLRGRALIPPVL